MRTTTTEPKTRSRNPTIIKVKQDTGNSNRKIKEQIKDTKTLKQSNDTIEAGAGGGKGVGGGGHTYDPM